MYTRIYVHVCIVACFHNFCRTPPELKELEALFLRSKNGDEEEPDSDGDDTASEEEHDEFSDDDDDIEDGDEEADEDGDDDEIDIGSNVGLLFDDEEVFGTIIEFDDDEGTVTIEEDGSGDLVTGYQDDMFLE